MKLFFDDGVNKIFCYTTLRIGFGTFYLRFDSNLRCRFYLAGVPYTLLDEGNGYTQTQIDASFAQAGHDHDGSYYTEGEIDALIALYYTKIQVDNVIGDYRTSVDQDIVDALQDAAITAGDASVTAAFIAADAVITAAYILAISIHSLLPNIHHSEAHDHDGSYYTEGEIDALIALYYTRVELDAGQLDNRYYTETETDNLLDDKQDIDYEENDYSSWGDIGEIGSLTTVPGHIHVRVDTELGECRLYVYSTDLGGWYYFQHDGTFM